MSGEKVDEFFAKITNEVIDVKSIEKFMVDVGIDEYNAWLKRMGIGGPITEEELRKELMDTIPKKYKL